MLTQHLSSLTTFSAKCTPCMLIYSILSIYLIPLSNQTQEWNQPIIFFISNRTGGWNQPVPLEWNHDITFYLVPKQINQTHPKCLSSKSSLGLDRVFYKVVYIFTKNVHGDVIFCSHSAKKNVPSVLTVQNNVNSCTVVNIGSPITADLDLIFFWS
jgi:hypothetical protein